MSLTNKISPKLIISGAPASGKGTQCEYIKKEFNVIHLSTGDMLREAVNLKTNYGLEAKSYMDRGALVPDEIIINIVMARLAEDDCIQQGCLLDGFPRTPIQADTLIAAGFDCSAFIQLDVDDSMLVERVVGRRMDPITGKIYHLKYSPPPQDIISRLVHRSDDTEEKVVHRIAAYHENLNPILEKFQSKLLRLNGNRTPDQIWKDLRSRLPRRIKFEVIFVLGGPGSGKGTLCEKLSLQSGYEHLSAGDLLREELKSGSQYADMIRTISSQGGLVPAELVISLLSKAMYTIRNSSNGIKKKFLIDGFPRNFDNLVAWYNVMNDSCIVDFVLNLDCTEEVMKERILGRAKTSGRVDDNEETLVKRFHTFHQDTQPVLASFDRLGKLRTVDANLTPEYVLNESLQIVKSIQLIPPMTRTFAMIKPDALAKGVLSNIIDTIKSTGNLFIVMAKIIQFNSQVIEKFYSEHKNKSFFNNLKNFMSSGPSICLILEGVDAIRSWRTMMGPTDSNNAREIEPKSLRALYGTDSTMNAVHGSDSEFSAMREIDFIFSPSGEGISCQRNQILDINTNCLDDVFDSNNGNTSYVEYSFGGLILQETYAMIKPFTAEIYYDKIISIIKGHGFIITGEIKLQLTNDLAELFYQEHRGKGFFNNLIKYMTSRKIVGLKLKRNGAIYGWRNLMGPTDYIKACNERACDSIRALYATDGTKNAVHGSDSIISSQRELQFFFTIGRNELHEILPATSNSPTRPTLPPLLYHNNNNNNNSDNTNISSKSKSKSKDKDKDKKKKNSINKENINNHDDNSNNVNNLENQINSTNIIPGSQTANESQKVNEIIPGYEVVIVAGEQTSKSRRSSWNQVLPLNGNNSNNNNVGEDHNGTVVSELYDMTSKIRKASLTMVNSMMSIIHGGSKSRHNSISKVGIDPNVSNIDPSLLATTTNVQSSQQKNNDSKPRSRAGSEVSSIISPTNINDPNITPILSRESQSSQIEHGAQALNSTISPPRTPKSPATTISTTISYPQNVIDANSSRPSVLQLSESNIKSRVQNTLTDYHMAQADEQVEANRRRQEASEKLAKRLKNKKSGGNDEIGKSNEDQEFNSIKEKKLLQHKLQSNRARKSLMISKERAAEVLQKRLDEINQKKLLNKDSNKEKIGEENESDED